MTNNTNTNTNARFDFSDYTTDELDYTKDILVKALDAFAAAEIALCDAHIRHSEEETLSDWLDMYNALHEVENAINKR